MHSLVPYRTLACLDEFTGCVEWFFTAELVPQVERHWLTIGMRPRLDDAIIVEEELV